MLSVVMISVIMLSVVMLSVIMLSVVMAFSKRQNKMWRHLKNKNVKSILWQYKLWHSYAEYRSLYCNGVSFYWVSHLFWVSFGWMSWHTFRKFYLCNFLRSNSTFLAAVKLQKILRHLANVSSRRLKIFIWVILKFALGREEKSTLLFWHERERKTALFRNDNAFCSFTTAKNITFYL